MFISRGIVNVSSGRLEEKEPPELLAIEIQKLRLGSGVRSSLKTVEVSG